MPNSRAAAASTIKEALLKVIRGRAHVGFSLSQTAVPVETGALKKSGSCKDLPNGAQIDYLEKYASFVERGISAMWVSVRAYMRQGQHVRAHRRWQPHRDPEKYIEKSLQDSFKMFATLLDNELRAKFSNVRRG